MFKQELMLFAGLKLQKTKYSTRSMVNEKKSVRYGRAEQGKRRLVVHDSLGLFDAISALQMLVVKPT